MDSKSEQKLAYRIAKWCERHENHETRKLVGSLSWIVVPTEIKLTLMELLGAKHGLQTFGAYIIIVEVAARMPVRGTLANDNGPLKIEQISRLTGANLKQLVAAVDYLSKPPLRWIELVEWTGLNPGIPPDRRGDAGGTPGGRRGDGGTRAPACAPAAAAASCLSYDSEELKQQQQLAACVREASATLQLLGRMGRVAGPLLAAVDHASITPSVVIAIWHNISRRKKPIDNPAALIAKIAIEDDRLPSLTIPAVVAAVDAGLITSIRVDGCETSCNGAKLTTNSNGLYVNGELAVAVDRIADVEVLL